MRAALLGVVALGAGLSLAIFGLVPQDELARIARLQLPGGGLGDDGMSPLQPLQSLPGLGGAGGAPLVPPLPPVRGLGGAGGLPLVPVVPGLQGFGGAGALPRVPVVPGVGAGPSGAGAGGAGGEGVLLAELSDEEEPARLRSDLDDLAATVEEQRQALDELTADVEAKNELEARGEESRQDRITTYDDADELLVAALRELEHGSTGQHLSSLGSIAITLSNAAVEAEEWAHDAEAGVAAAAANAVRVADDALRRDDSFDGKLSLTVAVFQLREARRLALQP